jgi:hypothetical protein
LFIHLRGGPSHVDTIDLKVGAWTPGDLNNAAGYRWPVALMPNLAARANMFTIIRSFSHNDAEHERAQYFLETGRRLNPGLRSEIPHIGSVVAFDFVQTGRRLPSDTFPGFILLGYHHSDNGFLSSEFAPMTDQLRYYIRHFDGPQVFDRSTAKRATARANRSRSSNNRR